MRNVKSYNMIVVDNTDNYTTFLLAMCLKIRKGTATSFNKDRTFIRHLIKVQK